MMDKKNLWLLILLLCMSVCSFSQERKIAVYPVAFYNMENLFDTINQPDVNDEEFTPGGAMKWNIMKYRNKIENMSYAISRLAVDGPFPCADGPVAIGLAEVENRGVVEDLVKSPNLSGRKYGIVHYDSPDRRGIDVALIYDSLRYQVESSSSHRLVIPEKPDFHTRDQLLVTGWLAGEKVCFIVNHWPSRYGGEKESRPNREAAAALTKHIADSVLAADPQAKIVIMGDLNDDPNNTSCCKVLGAVRTFDELKPGGYYNTTWQLLDKGIGSLGYQGQWNLFDQIIVSANLVGKDRSTLKFVKAEVFNRNFLRQDSGKNKGYPKRTHASGVYLNGYSDHFPTIIYLAKRVK